MKFTSALWIGCFALLVGCGGEGGGMDTPTCGDGAMDVGETCDDGNAINGDGCDTNCTPSACGNGQIGGSEICDDGNTDDGDGCSATCASNEACGNGVVELMETCDDNNDVSGDGCDANCTTTACGNGVAAGSEACDDGNATDGDGCDTNCSATACGNGVVSNDETCDDGNTVAGDGCAAACNSTEVCGNAFIDAVNGELCDDGNLTEGDGCDSNCTITSCGNGVLTEGETCDDANLNNNDGCDENCTPTACGNGVLTGAEVCDDGNTADGDGCSATCASNETCGNGIIDAIVGEQCDGGPECLACIWNGPEILYYDFSGVTASVVNLVPTPPLGAATGTILGGLTQGEEFGVCTGGGLTGDGQSSNSSYVDSGWIPDLGAGSWTVSFLASNVPSDASTRYIWGDVNTGGWRCFSGGVAGAGNWIMRGPIPDITVSGGAQLTTTMTTFVYDASVPELRAYLDGALVSTVPVATTPNVSGAGPFKVGGYSSNNSLPLGAMLDEFRVYRRALSTTEVASVYGSYLCL